jgi:hypothetical protein
MGNFALRLGLIGLCFTSTACVSYTGVTQAGDGQLYISGGTSYVFYTAPWVRRCEVDGMKLDCVELSESPNAARGTAASGETSTPAPAPAPAKKK